MADTCTWGNAIRLFDNAIFFAALFYLVLVFAVSLSATSLVMWLYRRSVLSLMSSTSADVGTEAGTEAGTGAGIERGIERGAERSPERGPEATFIATPLLRPAAAPLEPQALVLASALRQRQLRNVLVLACAVFSVVAGVLTTLSPDIVMNPQGAQSAPRPAGLLLVLGLLDVLVIAALCMPLVLIGVSHPRFKSLYWRRFVPWLLVAVALRVGLAASDDGFERFAAGLLALPANGVFVSLFYLAVARRHARQIVPLVGALLGTVVGALALGGVFVVLGVDCQDGLDVLLMLLGLLVLPLGGLWAAWRAMRWLARAYEQKRFSDAQVQVGSWLLCLTAISSLAVLGPSRQQAGPWGPLLLAATAAAVATYLWRLRRLQPWQAPRSLLLLRVFAHDERGEKLLDETAYRWRFIGPIHMIGGPDMAQQSLEPHELVSFLTGHVQEQFVVSREQLQQRLLTLDEAPDPDRRFRVNELFCQGDIWKTAVRALARRCDVVMLDLRGFTALRGGTAHEIGLLALMGLLGNTVCLVDAQTDLQAVRAVVCAANAQASLEQAKLLFADQNLQADPIFEALAAVASRPLPRVARRAAA